MGLLRKLAGLVVEFPEEQQTGGGKLPRSKSGSGDSQDVVAAIEELTRNIENSAKPDFDSYAGATSTGTSATPPAAKPTCAGASPDATPAEGGPGIKMPVILNVAQVYDRAQIKPGPDGFDLNKVEAMLSHPDIANLPVEIRARSVKMALQTMGKDLRAVLEDAALRDKALDDYLVYLEHRVQQVEEQVAAANAGIKREIEEFITQRNAIIASNATLAEQARQSIESYRSAKLVEEERLYNIVAPFVSPGENPVIVSNEALPASQPQPKGGEKK